MKCPIRALEVLDNLTNHKCLLVAVSQGTVWNVTIDGELARIIPKFLDTDTDYEAAPEQQVRMYSQGDDLKVAIYGEQSRRNNHTWIGRWEPRIAPTELRQAASHALRVLDHLTKYKPLLLLAAGGRKIMGDYNLLDPTHAIVLEPEVKTYARLAHRNGQVALVCSNHAGPSDKPVEPGYEWLGPWHEVP